MQSDFTNLSRIKEQCTDLPPMAVILNPSSPKSDQRQISPCDTNALQNRVVMRITDMITQDEFV